VPKGGRLELDLGLALTDPRYEQRRHGGKGRARGPLGDPHPLEFHRVLGAADVTQGQPQTVGGLPIAGVVRRRDAEVGDRALPACGQPAGELRHRHAARVAAQISRP
jgi:hypothetical protein